MPRISINEKTTLHWSFDEDVTHFQALHVGGIGVWRRKLADFGEERGVEMLRESGLEVSSLACAGGFTGADGHTFREAVDDAIDALCLAAEMQASSLIVVTGARASHTHNHARRIVVEAMKELGDVAGELGVEVAIQPADQPVNGWSFLTSIEATIEVLERCSHPHVGLVFDIAQFQREVSLASRMSQIVPWIKIAGLAELRTSTRKRDANMAMPGAPTLPEIVQSLEANGFRGWYDVNILCEECWVSDYERLLSECCSHLHSACPQLFVDGQTETVPSFAAPSCGETRDTPRFADERVSPI